MGLLDSIKQAAAGTIEDSNPVAIHFGTITQQNPLEVNVDQRLILSEDFFVLGEDVRQKNLRTGDTLLLLRVQGGQSYVVLDRV